MTGVLGLLLLMFVVLITVLGFTDRRFHVRARKIMTRGRTAKTGHEDVIVLASRFARVLYWEWVYGTLVLFHLVGSGLRRLSGRALPMHERYFPDDEVE